MLSRFVMHNFTGCLYVFTKVKWFRLWSLLGLLWSKGECNLWG